MSLFDPFDLQARLTPDNLALAFGSFADTLSYGELRRQVRGAAGLLERFGGSRDRRIGVHCQNPFLQIACALGASHLGVSSVVFSSRGEFPSGSVDIVACDGNVSALPAQTLRVEARAMSEAPGPRARADGQANPLWVFMPAREGTNQAAVTVTERALAARIMMRAMAKGGACAGRLLCVANIRSEIGFSAVLESLWFGGATILSRGTLEGDARSVALYDVATVFFDADALPEYFRDFQPKRAHGVHPTRIIVGGIHAGESLLVGMKRHLCADVAVHLDASETGCFAASAPWQIGSPRTYWPIPGVAVAVVGSEGRQVAPNIAGTIVVKSEGAVTAAPGHPAAGRFSDGWFISPLAGSQLPNGAFVLS